MLSVWVIKYLSVSPSGALFKSLSIFVVYLGTADTAYFKSLKVPTRSFVTTSKAFLIAGTASSMLAARFKLSLSGGIFSLPC
jgi:hypothetical protein